MAKSNGAAAPTNTAAGMLDIRSTDDLAAMVEAYRQFEVDQADYFANLERALQRRIERELKRRGLDSRGMLGSDATRAARRVTRHLAHIADLKMTIARALTETWRNYNQHVVEPVRQLDEAKEEFKV